MAEKIVNTKMQWRDVLSWWLDQEGSSQSTTVKQISNWHAYISQNFQYRFNWGLGSFLSLAIDQAHDGDFTMPSLEDWPKTELPWVVIWIKELITWGTLDPVASFLLARNISVTRREADEAAANYYVEKPHDVSANELLNPLNVRGWVEASFPRNSGGDVARPMSEIKASAVRDFSEQHVSRWRVVPVERGEQLEWFDVAGYRLASGPRPNIWDPNFAKSFDFVFDSSKGIVEFHSYIDSAFQPS